MLLFLLALLVGLAVLLWSAALFVDGSVATARHFRIPPLLTGMLIVGFGTSAPEMAVSAISASQGNPDIALGNVMGSNITNIALILGMTALLSPVSVRPGILRKELPVLTLVTFIAALFFADGIFTRQDAVLLLVLFALLTVWSIREGFRRANDRFSEEMAQSLELPEMSQGRAGLLIATGFVLLLVSSRLLVWGAVGVAEGFGVSKLVIGLTIIAIGTSLPELASSIMAARKGEHEIALGNVLGSNLFNILVVAGIAGVIYPSPIDPVIFSRDILVMSLLTVSLFFFGFGFHGVGSGRISRFGGALLLGSYVSYTVWLLVSAPG